MHHHTVLYDRGEHIVHIDNRLNDSRRVHRSRKIKKRMSHPPVKGSAVSSSLPGTLVRTGYAFLPVRSNCPHNIRWRFTFFSTFWVSRLRSALILNWDSHSPRPRHYIPLRNENNRQEAPSWWTCPRRLSDCSWRQRHIVCS